MADLGAAFGFYPQLNRRRQGSPTDSANLPVDVLRGRLAGLLGLLPDMANLLRSPSPTEMFGDVSYEAPAQFPCTTEKFLKDLPLAPTSRVGQVAGQAASFVPLNPMPAVRGVQKVGQMVGEELAATMMGQRPSSMMSKVVPQPLFAVAPEGLLSTKVEPIESLLQVKPQAPVSDIGFYSATEQAALNLGRNKGTGQSFINDLMKAPDVKKEELAYTGLDDFLRDKPNVTKQEVQDFLANNRVDVQETQLGGSLSPEMQATRDALNDKYKVFIDNIADAKSQFEEGKISYAELRNTVSNNKIQTEALDSQINEINQTISPTKFGKYQLAGGENYREILLTLPSSKTAMEEFLNVAGKKYGGNTPRTQWSPEDNAMYEQLLIEERTRIPSEYRSSHFSEPNILAHMRVNDRVDADGKKMLLVEEIQSDWHQAGREKGYKTKESLEKWYSQNKLDDDPSFADLNSEQRSVIERNRGAGMGGNNAVPDAPFKDTWYQLALKRLTKYAADNGYERIGLTTGKRQIERFADELRQNVDEIAFSSGYPSKDITTISASQNGQLAFTGTVKDGKFLDGQARGKTVEEVLGKSMAKQIAEKESGVLKGDDLTIGGEGMKKYYDEIYPKFLDKYGKKYGASVGETKVNTVMERADNSMIPQMGQEPVRYLNITPQMKEGTSKGQPLFAATPLLPATSLLDEEKRKEITSLLE